MATLSSFLQASLKISCHNPLLNHFFADLHQPHRWYAMPWKSWLHAGHPCNLHDAQYRCLHTAMHTHMKGRSMVFSDCLRHCNAVLSIMLSVSLGIVRNPPELRNSKLPGTFTTYSLPGFLPVILSVSLSKAMDCGVSRGVSVYTARRSCCSCSFCHAAACFCLTTLHRTRLVEDSELL